MGHAYAYRCDYCDFREDFNQGHGFLVHSQLLKDYLNQGAQIFHYKTHNLLARLSGEKSDLFLKAGFQIYKCPKCRTLHDKVEVTVFENEKVVHKSEFRCKKCKSRLKLTNIHRLKKAICPKCFKRTFHRDTSAQYLWD
jgi:predicted RNA-binding Zn-ribbon protein involved in translation (DUF1610 family)